MNGTPSDFVFYTCSFVGIHYTMGRRARRKKERKREREGKGEERDKEGNNNGDA